MIDSIAAVKKVIYDDKAATMDELVKALDANFEGYEVLQQMRSEKKSTALSVNTWPTIQGCMMKFILCALCRLPSISQAGK